MWRAHTSALVPWQDAPGGITSRQRTPLWPQVALRRPEFGPRCAVSVPYSSREVMRRLNASCWRAAVLFQALFTCVCQRCSFGSCVVLRLSRSIAASTTASSPHAARMLQQPHQPRSTLLPGTCTFKKASAMCLLACTVCSLSRLQSRRWCAERSLCANASVRCVWPDHITQATLQFCCSLHQASKFKKREAALFGASAERTPHQCRVT